MWFGLRWLSGLGRTVAWHCSSVCNLLNALQDFVFMCGGQIDSPYMIDSYWLMCSSSVLLWVVSETHKIVMPGLQY